MKRRSALGASWLAALAIGCSTTDTTASSSAGCPVEDVTAPDVTGSDITAADAAPIDVMATDDVASEPPTDRAALRPRANPIETIGLSLERAMTLEEFEAFATHFFGADAGAGAAATDYALGDTIRLSATPDPRTPDQVILEGSLIPAQPADAADVRRTIARVATSRAYGALFVDAVKVATHTALAKQAENGIAGEPFWLEYRSRSSNGGTVAIRFDFVPDREPRTKLIVSFNTAGTSLLPGKLNTPAFSGDPYESIAGTAWFRPSREEFQFFVQRAYGISPGAEQNFNDFQLLPHSWLRLTVTPKLADKVVDVGFEVITLDGRRVPFARAPASYLAGDQFRQAVLTMVHQNELEKKAGNAITDWQSPFYYDDPAAGGVVSVVAQGHQGNLSIAYAVESPIHVLRDVDFVPYPPTMTVPDSWPTLKTACSDLGSYEAPQGRMTLTFSASEAITALEKEGSLKAPLKGHVWGSIYKAEDVTIAGPNEGSKPVLDFDFPDVDIQGGKKSQAFTIDEQIAAGAYQVLGFMDIDNNAVAGDVNADKGDPVFIPIGGFELTCYEQPFDVQFAITMPEGY